MSPSTGLKMNTPYTLLENHRVMRSMIQSERVKHTNYKANTDRETSGKAVSTPTARTGWLDRTDGEASYRGKVITPRGQFTLLVRVVEQLPVLVLFGRDSPLFSHYWRN